MIIPKRPYKRRKDGVMLYIAKSAAGFYIKKVGTNEIYAEAIDVENAPFEYEETDIKIEPIEEIVEPTEENIEPIEEHEV